MNNPIKPKKPRDPLSRYKIPAKIVPLHITTKLNTNSSILTIEDFESGNIFSGIRQHFNDYMKNPINCYFANPKLADDTINILGVSSGKDYGSKNYCIHITAVVRIFNPEYEKAVQKRKEAEERLKDKIELYKEKSAKYKEDLEKYNKDKLLYEHWVNKQKLKVLKKQVSDMEKDLGVQHDRRVEIP